MRTAKSFKVRSRGRKGSVIILALSILTPVMIAGGSLLSSVHSYSREVELTMGRMTARFISGTGAHEALARLAAPDRQDTIPPAMEFKSNGGVAVVTLSYLDRDGLDNNADGLVDDASEENLVSIRSEAWLGSSGSANAARESSRAAGVWYRSVVQANARVVAASTLLVQQAVYIDDPYAGFVSSGDRLEVQGGDLPAFGVPGPPDALLSQMSATDLALVTGAAQAAETDPVDLAALAAAYRELASVVLPHSAIVDGEYLAKLEQMEPGVIYAPGDLTIAGDGRPSGMLVVEGDLVIRGNFRFSGVIMVRGKVRMGAPLDTFESLDPLDPVGPVGPVGPVDGAVGTDRPVASSVDSTMQIESSPTIEGSEAADPIESTITGDDIRLMGALLIGGVGDPSIPSVRLGGGVRIHHDDSLVQSYANTPSSVRLVSWSQDGSESSHDSSN